MSARQVLQDTWVQLQTHDYGVWTTRSLFIYALSAVAVIMVCRAVFRAYMTPLRHVPGPFLSKFTSLPLDISGLTLRKAHFVHAALQKYGPVVRVGPNMVVTNDRNDIKKVYGSTKVIKAPFYDSFGVINNERSCLSLRDPIEATHRRKCYLPLFSRRNLLDFAPKIYKHMQGFVTKLEEIERRGEAIDAFRWWRYLTFDVVTDLTFSGKFNMLKTGETDHPFVVETDEAAKWGLMVAVLPLLAYSPGWLLPSTWRRWKISEKTSLKHPIEALDAWKAENAAGTLDKSRVDAINTLLKHGEQYPAERLTDAQIIAALQELMVAGSDTTAMTASYLCWELARNPEVQQRLANELKEAMHEDSSTAYNPGKLEALESCKYLDAVCKEGLRLHPSVLTVLERVSPKELMTLGGKLIPPGTIVAMQSWSRHKDEEVYPEANAFRPERWLNETAQMKESLLTFSTGPRSCVGLNLAHLQLRLYIGTILREFRVSLHPSTKEEGMRETDAFLAKPVGGTCFLYFNRRKSE